MLQGHGRPQVGARGGGKCPPPGIRDQMGVLHSVHIQAPVARPAHTCTQFGRASDSWCKERDFKGLKGWAG